MTHPVSRVLISCFVVLLACTTASLALGQPPPPGGPAPAAAPPVDAPNPPPAAAAEVADFYAKLIAAKPADVDTVSAKAPEFPFCRLRLYVGPSVGDKSIVGVDYGIFRASGKVRTIALSGTSATFRSRLNQLLADPASASSKHGEGGVRIVDFWCQRSEQSPPYVPLLAKVWTNSQAADIPNTDSTTPVPGRVCYDDRPAIAECQHAFDYSPVVFKGGMTEIEAPASTVSAIAEALGTHRADIAALIAKQATDRPSTSRKPQTPDRSPAEATISLNATHALSEETCMRVGTAPRILAGGESFIGLTPEAKEGTVTLRQKLPFAIGGGVLRAPSRITSAKASIDVEVSKDGTDWTRVFLLDPARGRAGSRWEAKASYPLPKSLRGSPRLQVRARLASTDDATGLDRAGGPRFLDVVFRVPRTTELRVEEGLVRAVACRDPLDGAAKPFQLVIQPERLTAQAVSDLVQAGESDIDIYSPCDLDEAACAGIAKHGGLIRFWSPDDWQQHPPAWLAAIAAGEGRLEFAGLQEPVPALATAVASGKKSLSFPLADKPGSEVLAALATSTTDLSLDGIKELSAEQSSALSGFTGPMLTLGGLRAATISSAPGAALAAALVASSGTLTITGTSLPDAATLAILARGEKHLVLDGLESLDPKAAASLATCGNGLFLSTVASLPSDAAGPLLSYAGPLLSLPNLQRVECGFDALVPADRRPTVRLRAAVRQAAMEGGTTDPQAPTLDKELDALLAEAVEKGLATPADKERLTTEAKAATTSLAQIVDRLREVLPLLADGARLDLRTGTPLAAFLDAPGVFVLRPATSPAFRTPSDKSFWESLARGRKHLDLSALTTLDATAAAALATTENMLSLDGLTSLSPEVATALAAYKGPFLSLNGIEANKFNPQSDTAIIAAFEQLVRDDRASLAGLVMMNVDGLRKFCASNAADLNKSLVARLLAAGKPQNWIGVKGERLNKAWVKSILGTEVIFDTALGPIDTKIKGTDLAPASVNAIGKLAKDAKELAPLRTKSLFGEASGDESP